LTWAANMLVAYRGTSSVGNCLLPGPYSRAMPRTLGKSKEECCFL
jgi:hypothetical protein